MVMRHSIYNSIGASLAASISGSTTCKIFFIMMFSIAGVVFTQADSQSMANSVQLTSTGLNVLDGSGNE